MVYRIRRKWSNYDEGYVNSFGDEEVSRFESKGFRTKEEAEREKSRMTWKLDGLQEDFEITEK